jgi:hypothetical protein
LNLLILGAGTGGTTYDDIGAQLEVRLQELPESTVFRIDFVLTFEFSPDGKLLSYSTKVYLIFQ